MSRVILTHRSHTIDEIAAIVHKHGSFTAPLGLPHYRYDRTRANIRLLTKWGLIQKVAVNDIHHHFKAGAQMAAWAREGCPPVANWVKHGRSIWDSFFEVVNKYEKQEG